MQGWRSNTELHPKPPFVLLIPPVTHLTLEVGHKGHPPLTSSEVSEVGNTWFAPDCYRAGGCTLARVQLTREPKSSLVSTRVRCGLLEAETWPKSVETLR